MQLRSMRTPRGSRHALFVFAASMIALHALVIAGCSGAGETREPSSTKAEDKTTGHESGMAGTQMPAEGAGSSKEHATDAMSDDLAQAVETVVVKAGEFNFIPATFRIPAGKPVKIVLENQGTLDHDLLVRDLAVTIVGDGEETAEAANAEKMAHEMAMEGADDADRDEGMIVHVHAMPGENSFQVFTAHEPGTYHFACEIPGHKEAGMVGTVVVEG